jgi:hypothetical protein
MPDYRVLDDEPLFAEASTVGWVAFCGVSKKREIATTATTETIINPNVNSGPLAGLRLPFIKCSKVKGNLNTAPTDDTAKYLPCLPPARIRPARRSDAKVEIIVWEFFRSAAAAASGLGQKPSARMMPILSARDPDR